MPFLQQQDEEELKKQQELQNISGQSTVLNSTSVNPKSQKESGSWTNLNQYLDANKESADQMGSKIAGDITEKATTAVDKSSKLQDIVPEVKAYDPNQAYNNVTSLSDSDKQAYQTAKQGYTGPKALNEVTGYDDTQKLATKAKEQVQNAGNELGQQQLLKETYARPSYSQGQNKLDQLLLQNSAGSKKGFEDLTQRFSGINSMLDDSFTNAGNKINSNISTSLANKQAINVGDAKAKSDLLNPIQARAAQMNQDNPALIAAFQNNSKNNSLSEAELQRLGLTSGQNIYDMDLSAYLNVDGSQVNADNVANSDERARYAALTALIDGQAGQDITANARQIDPVKFDKTRFEADRTAKDTEYKNAYDNQRGTFLNNSYLYNPNADGGYAAYIPGAYTDRRDLNSATPQELESYWLPIFQRAQAETGYGIYGKTAEAIQKSVADWKAKYNPTRTIGKN